MKASPVGAIALFVVSVCWAFGSAWSRHLSMPKGLMSVAVQMMSGGMLLFAGEKITATGITAMVIISAGVVLVALGQRGRTI